MLLKAIVKHVITYIHATTYIQVNLYSRKRWWYGWFKLVKRQSEVQKKNMQCEWILDFDQWKTFYKYTENYCSLSLFSSFIQTCGRYPVSLDKSLIWKLLVILSLNFSKLLENLLLVKCLTSFEILQLQVKFQTVIVSCSRFIWVTNSNDHRRFSTANLSHTK